MTEICDSAHSLAYHPLYRTSQFFQFFILFFALFPLVYLLWFKLKKSSFHGNLKWLLAGYFGSILAFTLDFLVLVGIQIIVPFLSTDNCSLIIDRKFYGPANISVAFFMTLPTFFPISITIERFLATRFAEKYDQKPVILGPILTIFVVLLDFLIIFWIYKGENFDGGNVNLMLFPTTTAPKIYTLFWVLLCLNIINIFFNLALLKRNSRLKTINCSLSAKYQLEEVYLSTVFSISVIFLHIFFYGIYTSIIMFSRYFGQLVIRNSLDLSAARGAQIMIIDTFNLIISIVAVYLFKKIKEKKSIEISGTIQMKSTGRAGVKNYEEAINNIWNSHSRRI